MEQEPGADGAEQMELQGGGSEGSGGLGDPGAGAEEKKTQLRPPRPGRCRRYVRVRMAEALPGIVTALVKEAEAGSVAHTKLLISLSGIDQEPVAQPKARRTKGVVGRLLDELEEKDRLQQEDNGGGTVQ